MRRLFLLLAILAAAVSGWTPVMAASMQVSMQASMAATEPLASAAGHRLHGGRHEAGRHGEAMRGDGRETGGHHGDQKHGTVHPLLCSACFAVVAESPYSPRVATIAADTAVAGTALTGGNVLPPVPPPRPLPF